jgi:death-on-curing protein
MEYLLKEDFILINKKTVAQHGGSFVSPSNFLHEPDLDYLLEAVDSQVFGQPLYPSIADKASLYMFNVISNHIFQDGNKRTGLAAALLFLKLNGKNLKVELTSIRANDKSIPNKGNTTNEILFHFTMELASGLISLEECKQWFAENIN